MWKQTIKKRCVRRIRAVPSPKKSAAHPLLGINEIDVNYFNNIIKAYASSLAYIIY